MKNVHAVVGVGLLLAALAFQAGSVGAAEETVTGTVSVAKNDAGEATAVTLTTDDGTSYAVTMDDDGKKLAAMDGKKAVVTGTVGGTEEAKTIKVSSCKAAPEEKAGGDEAPNEEP